MKRIYIISIFFICLNISKAQNYVTIPDANFVSYLQSNYPSCMDEDKMDTTCVAIKTATFVSVSQNITDLTGIQYFTNLQYLDCSYNKLTTFPPLPNSLIVLVCNNNLFTSLPSLPNSLQYIYCYRNNLTSISSMPNFLKGLDCQDNMLTSLTNIPNSLELLFCSSNNLTALPSLPNSLISISCANNLLTSLPELPNSLKYLYCANNQLTSLPGLPDTLLELYAYANDINCFPAFPNSLKKIFIGNNPFTCLPNYVNAMDATTKAYPLCMAGNVNNPYNCLQVVSIEENEISSMFKIYPNPGSGNYIIEFNDWVNIATLTIKIDNLLGEQIINSKVQNPLNTIDLNQYPNGIYIVKINGLDFSTNRRILKQ